MHCLNGVSAKTAVVANYEKMKFKIIFITLIIFLLFCSCNQVVKQGQDNEKEQKNTTTAKENSDSTSILIENIESEINSDYIFSQILPINQSTIFYAEKDNIFYEMELKRIDEKSLNWKLTTKRNGIIVSEQTDTVIYYPKRGGSVRLKYGYRCSGLKFLKEHPTNFSTQLNVDTTNQSADFISFYHTDYTNNNNSIKHIPPLKRPKASEPYLGYLKSLLQNMTERYENYQQSNNQRAKEIYDDLYSDFLKLLEEIEKNNSANDVIKDTFLLDLVNYHGMDSVVNRLINFGFSNRKRMLHSQEQIISIKNISGFRGLIEFSKNGAVKSNRFEKFNVKMEPIMVRWIPGFNEYSFYHDSTALIPYQKQFIAVLHDFGFESISHIITIWEKRDSSLILEGILDKLLYEGIGGIRIDTIVQFGQNRNIIIGTSGGGDGGDVWGSFWIGIWELPRNLKVVFEKRWNGNSESFKNIDFSFISKNELSIIEKSVWYENNNGDYIEKDSIFSSSKLQIDSIINIEHIKRRSY